MGSNGFNAIREHHIQRCRQNITLILCEIALVACPVFLCRRYGCSCIFLRNIGITSVAGTAFGRILPFLHLFEGGIVNQFVFISIRIVPHFQIGGPAALISNVCQILLTRIDVFTGGHGIHKRNGTIGNGPHKIQMRRFIFRPFIGIRIHFIIAVCLMYSYILGLKSASTDDHVFRRIFKNNIFQFMTAAESILLNSCDRPGNGNLFQRTVILESPLGNNFYVIGTDNNGDGNRMHSGFHFTLYKLSAVVYPADCLFAVRLSRNLRHFQLVNIFSQRIIKKTICNIIGRCRLVQGRILDSLKIEGTGHNIIFKMFKLVRSARKVHAKVCRLNILQRTAPFKHGNGNLLFKCGHGGKSQAFQAGTVSESVFPHRFQRYRCILSGQVNVFKRRTSLKYGFPQFPYRSRHCKVGQSHTIIKSIITDYRDCGIQSDICLAHTDTLCKSAYSNDLQTIIQGNSFQVGTSVEGIITDSPHARAYLQGSDIRTVLGKNTFILICIIHGSGHLPCSLNVNG